MQDLYRLRALETILACLLALGPLPGPALAQEGTPPAPSVDPSIQLARDFIKSGDYDQAIEVLKAAIQEAREQLPRLQEAYLLLIKTYVFLGNDLKFRPQGREAANLNYKEARNLVAECLRIRELRHTTPEPATEYPPEMLDLFASVRAEIFGSFRVIELLPAEAVVLLDADTLRAAPGESGPGDTDLAVGPHLVVVRWPGYKDLTDEVSISPNSTLERSYALSKKRGKAWYTLVAGGTAAAIGGAVALIFAAGGEETTPAPEPLPGPPAPPGN